MLLLLAVAAGSCDSPLSTQAEQSFAIPEYGHTPLPELPAIELKNLASKTAAGTDSLSIEESARATYELLNQYIGKRKKVTYAAAAGRWKAKKGQYKYKMIPLSFPEEIVRKAEGRIIYYSYHLTDPKTRVLRKLGAIIPGSEEAAKLMDEWLVTKGRKLKLKTSGFPTARAGSPELDPIVSTEDCTGKKIIEGTCLRWDPDIGWGYSTCSELAVCSGGGSGDDDGGDNWPDDGGNWGGPPTDDDDSGGGGDGSGGDGECTNTTIDGPCAEEPQPDSCETSAKQLKDTFPDAPESTLDELAEFINKHGEDFGIDTEEEMQHFLAQAAHESGNWKGDSFSAFEENLYYRVQNLGVKYWKTRFNPPSNPNADSDKANPFDYAESAGSKYVNRKKFANYIYDDANRKSGYKLGNTSAGDGYKYRGRGIFQLTGKDNYIRFNSFYRDSYDNTVNLVTNPSLVANNKEIAVISALWFFQKNVLDKGGINESTSVKSITKKVNGKLNGLNHRKNLYEQTKDFINCL